MIPIFGIASGLGASMNGSNEGPLTLQKRVLKWGDWRNILHPQKNFSDKNSEVLTLNQKLAAEVYAAVLENPFTMVVGGDHSCAIGTWSGVAEALRTRGEDLGLLWIDAHMDCHTHETSPSGNIHGMPLALLLGYGLEDFTQILSSQPKLKPENVFLIGIRSYEPAEVAFLKKLDIRVYFIEEVHERGLTVILSEIVENLTVRKVPYGISLDIDFFDPDEMSATGTPAENGTHPQEFIDNYTLFESNPPIAFEYVEFNPSRDTENRSLEWTVQILERVLHIGNLANKHKQV